MLPFPSPLFGKAPAASTAELFFKTSLYVGTGGEKTVTTNVNLQTHGGLIWTKNRSTDTYHDLRDTVRGLTVKSTPLAIAESSEFDGFFTTTSAYSLSSSSLDVNNGSSNYVSWVFRKAAKFFDIVTYTGNGATDRALNHNLTVEPGLIIVFARDGSSDWLVYHQDMSKAVPLNYGGVEDDHGYPWGNPKVAATSSVFTVNGVANQSSTNYVAYVFAHDSSGTSRIKCGIIEDNAFGTSQSIDFGWPVEFILMKDIVNATNWMLFDTVRGIGLNSSASSSLLIPNSAAANSQAAFNYAGCPYILSTNSLMFRELPEGSKFIYMAIRS